MEFHQGSLSSGNSDMSESQRQLMQTRIAELETNQSTLMSTCRSLAQEIERRDREAGTDKANVDTDLQRLSLSSENSSGLSDQSAHLFVRCKDLESALEKASDEIVTLKKSEAEQRETIDQLNAKLQSVELSKHSSDPAQHQAGLDRLVSMYKAKVAAAEEKQANAEVEQGKLRQHYVMVIESLRKENENLKKNQDRTQALEAQLQVYMDDFKSERADREAAQGRVSDLEQEVSVLREQLSQFQQATMARLHRNRMATLANLQNEYQQHRVHHGYNMYRTRGRPIECDGSEGSQDEDIIDSLSSTMPAGRIVTDGDSAGTSDQNEQEAESLLECPKCNKGYPAPEHAQFLEHIDKCCEDSTGADLWNSSWHIEGLVQDCGLQCISSGVATVLCQAIDVNSLIPGLNWQNFAYIIFKRIFLIETLNFHVSQTI